MPQKGTDGAFYVGNLAMRGATGAKGLFTQSGTVARTDTAAKNLFKLPKGAILLGVFIGGTVASNAGTSAVVDVGKTGTDNFFVAAHDVKTAGKGDASNPGVTKNSGLQSEVQVVGKYTEAGGASNTGGPWTVTAIFTK